MDTNFYDRLEKAISDFYPDGGGFDGHDYIHAYGSESGALLYAGLFIPETIIVLDSVLLSWFISNQINKSRFLSLASQPNYPIAELESSFNTIEVPYLFDACGRDSTACQRQLLADAIANSWDAVISNRYPSRKFVFQVTEFNGEDGNPAVFFHQNRE